MTKNNNKILNNSGWWILWVLSLLPIVFWIFEEPIGSRFSNPALIFRSLGDIAGLCGMAMFSLVMILSARFKFFEKFFKGMNELYTAHHVFGGLTLCLLLFHPLFLVVNYIRISFMSAALFLLPSAINMAKNLGLAGLFVMIIALVITFYTKLKYQVWKLTHKFLGLAFILAFLHTFLIGGDVASNQSLRIYLFVLGIFAIIVYFYRTLFADYMVRVFEYTIFSIKSLPDKIWEIEFKPRNRAMNFTSGQFAFARLYSTSLTSEPHPFSFSSASGDPLKIAIKELGDYTNKIGSLKVGDLAKIEGPFGSFNFRKIKNKKQVWIAGGIGITPFLSMARDLSEKDKDCMIDLYYSIKNENCLAFKEELQEISQRHKNLNVIFWITEQKGFLNGESVKINTQDIKERDILICGPGPMMSSLKNQFLQQGINKNKIHTEDFQLY
jgi:predicted ferric reductase